MPDQSYIIKSNGLIDDLGLSGGSIPDEKAKVSLTDTTTDYLLNKVTAGDFIGLTQVNSGSDESLEIKVIGGDASTVIYDPATLADWNGGTSPGFTDLALDQVASRIDTLEGSINDAANLLYTPADNTDWNSSTDPGNTGPAIDQLADRVKYLEVNFGSNPDAANVTYTPAVNSNWNSSTDPGDVDNALDQLAARVKTMETNPPNASVIPYSPADNTDWNGSADPGDVDNALDQLADRVKVVEVAGALPTVAVSATDTTSDYLFAKITAGSRITVTKTNAGANEHVQITADIQDASIVTYTPGTLADWNSSADPGDTNDALNQLAARLKILEGSVGPTPDASAITYTPTTASDWTGSADPGDVDNALDQLAGRTKVLETHGGQSLVSGTDSTYDYLTNKIVAGTNVSIAVTGTTNKIMTISSSAGGASADNAEEMAWAGTGWNGTVTAIRLADGILTTTPTTLYTAPSGKSTRITSIIFNNTDATPQTITLALDDGPNTLVFAYIEIPNNSTFEFVPKSPLILPATMQIIGSAQSVGNVDYWMSGGERTQPGSGVRPLILYSGSPNSGTTLYTAPSGKKTVISYISNHVKTDPSTPNGQFFDFGLTSVAHSTYRAIYTVCQKYRDTQYFHPMIILEDGDVITGGTESSAGDLIICGWESDV